MTRRILLALVVVLAVPVAAFGGDDPHGQAFDIQCLQSCHEGHKAAGANLTIAAANENVCFSCHNSGGTAKDFDLDPNSKASLVTHFGKSHAWDVPVVNSSAGANNPSWTQMLVRLDGGKIICSTCHDQHGSDEAAVTTGQAGTQYQASVVKIFNGGGSGTLAYTATATSPAASYIVEITTGGATGTAQFRHSKDGGLSWFATQATAANVAVDAAVTIQFTGTFAATDKFRFYVGYPFLRLDKANNVAVDAGSNSAGDKFCRICHADWVMDHTAIDSWDGAAKSHPVGVALNANGAGYDRGTPLDGYGGAPGSDGNSTNDLALDSGGLVQCLTCHGVHHADSNTLTVDQP